MHAVDWFTRFAKTVARLSGRPQAFTLAVLLIFVWLATGPLFGFSNTWQLIVNTGTTIITFLMVFIIQSTQNRDAEAVQIKLDELIRSTRGAHNEILDLEDAGDEELQRFHARYQALANAAREKLKRGGKDTDVPDA
jgi:low affinity Fe/Cu permease